MTTRPRRGRDRHQEQCAGLTDSVGQVGVLQPILVRPNDSGYEIVCDARRYRAAIAAGLEEIPADVHDAAVNRLVEKQSAEDVPATQST